MALRTHSTVQLSAQPSPRVFLTTKGNPVPGEQAYPAPRPLQPLAATHDLLSVWICLFWAFHVNGVIQDVALCVWLLSLSMFLRFAHILHESLLTSSLPRAA